MSQNFINSRSLGWIVVENLSNQVTSLVGYLNIVREVVGIHSDAFVSGFDITSLKWGLTDDKCVDYYTD